MRIGVGNQGEAVQSRHPPVHRRVGGKAGFHRVDVSGQVAKTFFHRVKAGKSPEHREMRRPDMGGDKYRLRAGIQRNFQQIPAVQPKDGTPIRMDIADGFQPVGEGLGILQRGQQNYIVNLAGPAAFFVDGTDFPGQNKPRCGCCLAERIRQTCIVPQAIQPVFGRNQLFCQFGSPSGMGKVPSTQKLNAFSPCPKIQMGGVAISAGGPGVFGMDMQIRNIQNIVLPGVNLLLL